MANPDDFLYEYAVVRYVPDIERGEFVNVGLIMMCKRRHWIEARFNIDAKRIFALLPGADIQTLSSQLKAIENIVKGSENSFGGPIADLEAHERFRWLTAVRSASIRTSRPHAGLTHNLSETFADLFHKLIM